MIYVENNYVLPAQASYQLINKHCNISIAYQLINNQCNIRIAYQLINKHCNISIAYIIFDNYNKHKRGTIQAKGIHVSIEQISRFHCQAYCKVRYNINPA